MAYGWTPSVVPHPQWKNVSTLSPNPRHQCGSCHSGDIGCNRSSSWSRYQNINPQLKILKRFILAKLDFEYDHYQCYIGQTPWSRVDIQIQISKYQCFHVPNRPWSLFHRDPSRLPGDRSPFRGYAFPTYVTLPPKPVFLRFGKRLFVMISRFILNRCFSEYLWSEVITLNKVLIRDLYHFRLILMLDSPS